MGSGEARGISLERFLMMNCTHERSAHNGGKMGNLANGDLKTCTKWVIPWRKGQIRGKMHEM